MNVTWPTAWEALACIDCDGPIPAGAPYSQRLVAMDPLIGEITETVCVACGVPT